MKPAEHPRQRLDVDRTRAINWARLRWPLAAAVVLALAMACGWSTGGLAPTLSVERTVPATEATPPMQAATSDLVTEPPPMVLLRLVNRSDSPICYVIVTPSYHANAGSSIWYTVETAGGPIAPGASYDFAGAPMDTYNLQAQDCDYRTVDLRREVKVGADYDWVIEESQAGETVEVVLVNESPVEICTVYLSRTGIGYTDDKVATSLPAGSRQTFHLPVGPYDLWVADCNHHEFGTTFGVEVMECATWTVDEAGGKLSPGCEG